MFKTLPQDEKAEAAAWSKREIAEAKKQLSEAAKISDDKVSRSLRSGVVLAALAMMLVGFVLQLIGTWPK